MVKSLANKDIAKFVCAGGTMSHYVADACNSLHISYLHHGRNESETNVHRDYENKVIDKNKKELFKMINDKVKTIGNDDLIKGGNSAARKIIDLMNYTVTKLPPETICDSFTANLGKRNRIDNMWNELKEGTADTIAKGCMVMAILWQSAWLEGNGDKGFENQDLVEISKENLKMLYNDKTFVPSFRLNNPLLKDALEKKGL